MNAHHRTALKVLAVTVTLDVIFGIAFGYASHVGPVHGLYCATGTATTVGCDVSPDSPLTYALSFLEMLTIVPLFGAAFSFFTTGLTADHVDRRHRELNEKLPNPPAPQ